MLNALNTNLPPFNKEFFYCKNMIIDNENGNLKLDEIESQTLYGDLLLLATTYAKHGEYVNAAKVVELIIECYPERILNLRDSLKNKNGGDPR